MRGFRIAKAAAIDTPDTRSLRARLGPGLLFAAAAVGTSHLVQSTRAGAAYGLTLGALILAVCLVKYPLFRFAADYAAATGESLVRGYRRRGRVLVGLMFGVSAIEAVAAVAGVALVTAGIAKWLLGITLSDTTAALLVMALTAALVGVGRYRLLESFATVFVVLFSVLTVLATGASLPLLGAGDRGAFGAFGFSADTLSFATAVSGWMPVGNTASIMLAAWVLARADDRGPPTLAAARFDFNVGYLVSSLLALCFLLMGAAVLYGRGLPLPGGGAQFATTFTDMFAGAVGYWSRLLVAVLSLAVMYSTLLAIVDGFPRMLQEFLVELGWLNDHPTRARRNFLLLLIVVTGGAGAFLAFFMRSFTTFIDLVTITGFIAAPIVAWANHAVLESTEVPASARPGAGLTLWSRLSVAALLVASAGFLYFRFA